MISCMHLWGKKSLNGIAAWLPLIIHLSDTSAVGRLIWDEWVSPGAKKTIADSLRLSRRDLDAEQQARALFIYLCAIHDLGKATPDFQLKSSKITSDHCDAGRRSEYVKAASDMDALYKKRLEDDGFVFPPAGQIMPFKTPHALASQIIAAEFGGVHRNIAYILGAHHGKPADYCEITVDTYPSNFYGSRDGKENWQGAWRKLLDFALSETPFQSAEELPVPTQFGAVLLAGLLVMADWISSNETYFPYIGMDDDISPDQSLLRAEKAWQMLNFTHPWMPDAGKDLYSARFGFARPNEIQSAIVDAAQKVSDPGIFVLEAPMGIGKTEAALGAAEILAARTGHSGIFFALPTQATSNGIFERMELWAERLKDNQRHSIELFHGKAQYNETYTHIPDSSGIGEDSDDPVFVHSWFNGRKKSMLADFVVGTIDQVLLAALKQKHFMLRHLGLANKIVIIDECHAYDAYMNKYLERVLSWLGAYRVPVIVLSATLPAKRRQSVIYAYLGKSTLMSADTLRYRQQKTGENAAPTELWQTDRHYPLLTYTDGQNVVGTPIALNKMPQTVKIEIIDDQQYTNILSACLADGGCAGIIVNSVAKAQAYAEALKQIFRPEEIVLCHSRFLATDRAAIESRIVHMLGKPSDKTKRPERLIVVGTQVLEQSLDIDFDVMFTDLCPMDLLLQRMGRLHRHNGRQRPALLAAAACYVLSPADGHFDKASSLIYGDYLLSRTRFFLPSQICLPDDISSLVQRVYDENEHLDVEDDAYLEAFQKETARVAGQESRAKAFCLCPPGKSPRSNILGMLDTDAADGENGEAAVRDTNPSIEVILLHKNADEQICIYDDADTVVARNETPSDELAREIARYTVKLPPSLCYNARETIDVLEHLSGRPEYSPWQKSSWLKGALFLIMEQNDTIQLCGHLLTYSHQTGLACTKGA